MVQLRQFSPRDVLQSTHAGQDFPQFPRKLLAQGDSWFSFGSLNPTATQSILNPMEFDRDTCAVNCAHPGDVLSHMVDQRREPNFMNLLTGNQRWRWDAILLSPGGNDLIDFIRTPMRSEGKPVPQELRALLTKSERGNATAAKDFISEKGWQTFVQHIVPQFHEFIALRDSPHSESKGCPIIVHSYDFIMPRNAGAGAGAGPWLYPALIAYEVPEKNWMALSKLFLTRFKKLLQGLNLPNFHVIDTQGTAIPAAKGSEGDSNDWANEIHPNPGGYRKLGEVYAKGIAPLLP